MNKDKKHFLGIDQSFTSTGIAVLDEASNVVKITTIKSDKSIDIFQRAWLIAREISNLINEYTPEVVGLEGLAFSKFGDATRDLAGLQFTLVNYLRHVHFYDEVDGEFAPNTNLIIISPNELRKFATTKGNAKKEQMVDSLPKNVLESFQKKNYKKTTGLYDVTDAYWIARYVLEVFKRKSKSDAKSKKVS